jgi:hypothetical protein
MTMKSSLPLILKENVLRILLVVLGVEVLIFSLPTEGKIEGSAVGYWGGVWLRLSSANYWGRALLSGIGLAVVLAALVAFSSYLARFVKPPSSDGGSADRNNS